jgi:serine/threonine-protein kinase
MSQWARVNDLFHAALDRALSDRDAFVVRECGGDGRLRAEVESLLAAHEANAASLSASRLDAGTRVGGYQVTAFLAAGAMGQVYRARDTKLGREVALKILPPAFVADPDRRARFEREARLLASLNHPNIATIYGFEEQTDIVSGVRRTVHALAMELVEGETLAERIGRGRISVDEALRIAKQIAGALEAAHEQGIIHRDLKPANIKLTRDGVVKVLDFGLAKLSQPEADVTVSPTATGVGLRTGVGVLVGTPAYMSPEQARGETVDKRTDIWAFGCVLYEMLADRRPFGGASVSDTLADVLKTQPDWKALPTDVPPLIRSLVEDCLEKDRTARVADIAAARFALGRHAVVPGVDASIAIAPRRTARRLLVPVGVTTVVAGALTFVMARSTSPLDPIPALKFRMLLEDEQRFTATGRNLVAIAPDGSHVVYVANNRLFTRRMSELDATPITGTEEFELVTSPALSPDGSSVVFFAEGSLRRVAVTGGTASTICAASNPFGVSWTGETILFSQSETGILAVPANGGQPEIWVTTSPGETVHSPQFLPEANAILFSVTKAMGSNRWDEADVVIYSRDTGQRKILIHGGSAARYVGSGQIIYAVRGSLMAVPFDPQRLELTGRASPVLEQVGRAAVSGENNTGAANFAVSSDGTLAYVPAQGGPPRTLVWVDHQGRESQILQIGTRPFSDPRLSPDGQRIAIQIGDEDDDIWMFDLVRGSLTRQTFEPDEQETPIWSPDGRSIAYTSTEGGRSPTVFRRRADGTGLPEALWSAPGVQFHTHVEDWTADGRTLLISHGGTSVGVQEEITALTLDGDRTPTRLLPSRFVVRHARVSTNGRWLAYTSNESGREEVYVQPYPSLQGKWQISTGGGAQPVWSKNGDELFYRGEGSVIAVRISAGASFAAGLPQKLFQDHYYSNSDHTGYDVASDGRFLLVKGDPAEQPMAARPQIIVVQNWLEELKRLVPTN